MVYMRNWLNIWGLIVCFILGSGLGLAEESTDSSSDASVQHDDDVEALLETVLNEDLVSFSELLPSLKHKVDTLSVNGYNALHVAASNDLQEIVELLIASGANVSLPTTDAYSQNTALHFSILENNIEIAAILIMAGADKTALNSNGLSSIDLAKTSEEPLIRALFDGTVLAKDIVSIDAIDTGLYEEPDKTWPQALSLPKAIFDYAAYQFDWLHIAVMQKRQNVVAKILALGVNPDDISTSINTKDFSPIQLAIQTKQIDVVKQLVSAGAYLNLTLDNGNSLLHEAVEENDIELGQFLVSNNIDYSIENYANQTAFELAIALDRVNWFLSVAPLAHGYLEYVYIPLFYKLTEDALKSDQTDHNATQSSSLMDSLAKDIISSPVTLNRLLYEAVKNNEPLLIQKFVELGADINAIVDDYRFLELAAISENHQAMVALIKLGVNPDFETYDHDSLFSYVMSTEDDALHEALFSSGVDLSQHANASVLHTFIVNNNRESYVKFRDNYPQLPLIDEAGNTVFHVLLQVIDEFKNLETGEGFDTNFAKIILSESVDVNALNADFESALYLAVKAKDKDIVERLIEKGANTNGIEDRTVGLPLKTAIQNNQHDIALLLMRHGASWGHVDIPLKSITETILATGNPDLIEAAIESADINMTDTQGQNWLHSAIKNNQPEQVSALLKKGASVVVANEEGKSPLILALESQQNDITALLLEKAPNDFLDNQGNTLLHWAVKLDKSKMAKKLIKKGLDVNATNQDLTTPLHIAVSLGNKDIVELLLNAKAKTDLRNKDHLQALQLAFLYGYGDILERFGKHLQEPELGVSSELLYDDPRVVYWSNLALTGQKEKVRKSVEKDLLSDHPHPFSSHIWTKSFLSTELEAEYKKSSAELKNALGMTPIVDIAKVNGDWLHLFEQYPVDGEYTKRDAWALDALQGLADVLGDTKTELAYSLKVLQLNPNNFQSTWLLGDSEFYESKAYDTMILDAMESDALKESMALNAMKALTEWRVSYYGDGLAYLKPWIEHFPMDARVHSRVADTEEFYKRFPSSLSHSVKSYVFYPWYSTPSKVIRNIVRMGDNDRAKRVSVLMGNVYRDETNTELEASNAYRFIDGLYEAGEKGLARKALEEAILQYPQYTNLFQMYETLETGNLRYAQAAELALQIIELKKAKGDSAKSEDIKRLTDALSNDGRKPEAISTFEQYKPNLSLIKKELYESIYNIALELERTEYANKLLDEAISLYPLSTKLAFKNAQRVYKKGDKEQAISLLEDIIKTDITQIKTLFDWVKEVREPTVANQYLDDLLEKYPYEYSLVNERIKSPRENETTKDLALYWQDHYYKSNFALNIALKSYKDDKQWSEGYALLESYKTIFSDLKYMPSLSEDHLFQKADYLISWSQYETVPEELIENILQDIGDCSVITATKLTDCFQKKGELYYALGDKEQAAEAIKQEAEINPDDRDLFYRMYSKHSGALGGSYDSIYGYNRIIRDPYNSGPYSSYCHKHTLWGSSSASCLWAIDQAKKLGLDIDLSTYEKRAFGKLGDNLTQFKVYQNGGAPNASKRYVGWYDSAKQAALFNERQRIHYSFDNGIAEVEIVDEEGNVYKRREDIKLGKAVYFEKGPRFLKIAYDSRGNLAKLESSSGKWVQLSYRPSGKIDHISSSTGKNMRFEYNRAGKPIMIEIIGVGAMNVTYDSNNEISRVESDSGHKMALQVTQEFQNLMALVKLSEKVMRDSSVLETSDFTTNTQDSILTQHYNNIESQATLEGNSEALLKAISETVPLINMHPEDIPQLKQYIAELVSIGEENLSSESLIKNAASGIWWLSELYKNIKPYGLEQSEYEQWIKYANWLEGISNVVDSDLVDPQIQKIKQNNIQLFEEQKWLYKTDFANSGYWFYNHDKDLWPDVNTGQTSVLHRSNGDIVVGSNKGISVYSEGYWSWYAFDANSGNWSKNVAKSSVDNRSHVLSMSETEDGVLWLGTTNGLVVIQGEYDGDMTVYKTQKQGFASPRINHLVTVGDQVIVGTESGILTGNLSDGFESLIPELDNRAIKQLIGKKDAYGNVDKLLIATSEEIYSYDGEIFLSLAKAKVDDIAYSHELETLYYLENNRVYSVLTKQTESLPSPVLIGSQQTLGFSKSIHSLIVQELEGSDRLLVLSDTGINVQQGTYFEHLALPFSTQRGGLVIGPQIAAGASNGQMTFLTHDAVYRYQPNLVDHRISQNVEDLVYSKEQGITFIAMGDELRAMLDGDNDWIRYDGINATKLALAPNGNLITNDGLTVVEIKPGEDEVTELFRAESSEDIEHWSGGKIDHIFAASDGSIWVTAGASVYRYLEGELREFNYAIDPDNFPSRSNMLGIAYETIDHKIRVIASNDSHNDYKGISLVGGIMEFDGEKFTVLDIPSHPIFVTGYTAIDQDTAILSTNAQFYRENKGLVKAYSQLNDPSYESMTKKSKMLWLGGKGARFNEDKTWLFPTAGGLAVYHNGQWFYPDRLNQLLPKDQDLGQYGGRTVHAVSVDANGRVFAATDLGLMIYESQGVASLLSDHDRSDLVFADEAIQHQQDIRDIFVNQIDPESNAGKLISKFTEVDAEIMDLENNADQLELAQLLLDGQHNSNGKDASGEDSSTSSETNSEALKKKLAERERYRQKLLSKIERQHYGIYQMLKMDPREIAAMHKKLASNEALLQFLPTPEKLIIQLVTSEGAQIREVNIPKSKLDAIVLNTVAELRNGVNDIHHFETNSIPAMTRGVVMEDEENLISPEQRYKNLIKNLSVLYEVLLRPIERDLVGKDIIYTNASGNLNYLPLASLVRQSNGAVKYAGEYFNLGQMPSLFHFNLVKMQEESFGEGGLFVADPDGSLPGARQEVSAITAAQSEHESLVGAEATTSNILDSVMGKNYLHFATHGVLDTKQPEDSYLLLANKSRLSAIDIAMLDMEDIDLAVLSACESGIGIDGMEFATIARAFALSKVPTVIASYWMVDDAATRDLMVAFYENRDKEQNNFEALTNAQRQLIASKSALSHPSAWSAFSVYGRP